MTFDLRTVVKWIAVGGLLVFLGFMLGKVTYNNAMIMLLTLILAAKV